MVNEIIENHPEDLALANVTVDEAIQNFNKAVGKGVLKVMNKTAISTLNSYRGSQLFECIGISKKVVDKYFPRTVTRIQGVGLHQLEEEVTKRHTSAYDRKDIAANLELQMGGEYRWR